MSEPLAHVSMNLARRRETYAIDREAIIGSDRGCQIVIHRSQVAPRQARIAFDEASKRFVIENLGAPGSVRVNGAVVTGPQPLGAMSVITLGEGIELVFQATAPSGERPRADQVDQDAPRKPPEVEVPPDPRRTIREDFEPEKIDPRGTVPDKFEPEKIDVRGTIPDNFEPDRIDVRGTVRDDFEPDKIDVRGTVRDDFEPDKIDVRGTVRDDFEPDKIDVRGTVRDDFEPDKIDVPGPGPAAAEPPPPQAARTPDPPPLIAATRPAIEATQPAIDANQATIEATRPIPKRSSPRLVITDPPELAFEHRLSSGEILIGKSPECGIRITHWSVSRKHALLIVREGACRLKELGSMNGTFLDGRRIEGEIDLPPEAKLTFGEVAAVLSTRPR